jgi:hypothetical protein
VSAGNHEESLEAYRARLEALTGDEERALLAEIIRAGWEAGCWLHVDDAQLVRATGRELDEFISYTGGRTGQRVGEPEPYPEGLPHEPIEGAAPCWVVIAQKCDLVAGISDEPFVELARAYDLGDRNLAGNLWRNSNRVFPLDPRDKRWVVDLRHRALLPKDALRELGAPRQAVPTDADQASFRPRSRFLSQVAVRGVAQDRR